jgi:hypothetical protein
MTSATMSTAAGVAAAAMTAAAMTAAAVTAAAMTAAAVTAALASASAKAAATAAVAAVSAVAVTVAAVIEVAAVVQGAPKNAADDRQREARAAAPVVAPKPDLFDLPIRNRKMRPGHVYGSGRHRGGRQDCCGCCNRGHANKSHLTLHAFNRTPYCSDNCPSTSAAVSPGHMFANFVEFHFLFGVEAIVESDQLRIFRLYRFQPVFKKRLVESEASLKGGDVRLFRAELSSRGLDSFGARLLKFLVRRFLCIAQTQVFGKPVREFAFMVGLFGMRSANTFDFAPASALAFRRLRRTEGRREGCNRKDKSRNAQFSHLTLLDNSLF